MDEGNMFVEETLEARAELEYNSNAKCNILSAQSNKSEMVIVQDSLLAAYTMTVKVREISKSHFMKCMMHIYHDYDFEERLKVIRKLRNEENIYTTHALFGFLFPQDFHIDYPMIKISHGVVIEGYFDKYTLKGTKTSLVRVLCMEYGQEVASTFVDNIQFLTNGWLEMNPATVGIEDCIISDPLKKEMIRSTNHKYYIEADSGARSTDNPQIREARINCSLNKSMNVGLRSAKEMLKPDNNFINMVKSESKGSDFNVAQITGRLGQQNIDGHRPKAQLSNGKRSLIHYPYVIMNDPACKYRSRGFVDTSFMKGMAPDEMFFHAMTGREGMTKTAMGTATSGYIQRSIVKINEDLKIEYDGTVRDAKKNIYQFAYGGHGFDPSKVDIDEKTGEVYPVNFKRLAEAMNKGTNPFSTDSQLARFLTEEEIEEIVDVCDWRSNVPKDLYEQRKNNQDRIIRRELSKIKLIPDKYSEFKTKIMHKYHSARATPGECVGIIGAQSIGEKHTQSTLNTFHTAGKLQQSGVGRLEEILNMSKKLKVKTCTIFFKKRYTSAEELRKDVGCSITGLNFEDLYDEKPTVSKFDNCESIDIHFQLNPRVMFNNRINSFKIAKVVKQSVCCECSIGSTSITLKDVQINESISKTLNSINKIQICGMEKVKEMFLDYENGEWYAVTDGSNLKMMLGHPLIDNKRLYCNDFWEVYETLGIIAVRKMLMMDLKKVVVGVNSIHTQLLVDKMTYRGKPCSITRYTMRTNDVGPMSKATFEESVDILISAAMRTEVETNSGISSSIICGNRPRIGTGFMGLLVDYEKLMGIQEDVDIEKEIDSYIPEDF